MRGRHSLGHGFDPAVYFFPHEDCTRIARYNYNYNTIQVMFLVGAGFMIMLGKERSQILTLKLLFLKCQILIFVKP